MEFTAAASSILVLADEVNQELGHAPAILRSGINCL
jgi:hypothetical protein